MMLNRLISSSSRKAATSLASKSRPSPLHTMAAHQKQRPQRNENPQHQHQHQLQQTRHHGGPGPSTPTIPLSFLNPDSTTTTISARLGETLLQTAHRTGIEMEGACEGVCACSTCHVILTQEMYDRLLEEQCEEGCLGENEEDMLDMAFGLTHTSRLGCQVKVEEWMEGARIELPKATRNFYVDGHKPKPH
eukprot:CAMPEP_0171347630 /NCGR_PEP_ID=MMETSP0878-20121228/28504_1 /TAXON_ID=67004 /ORGANISM="Thalassiosira weissflogii, Strain CCMP1336" /LENGTH=190 /DNA_ID=CAMNT_0011851729 /DNA_START=73 /DNA_END=645 /DNA_ORIENTATION=+